MMDLVKSVSKITTLQGGGFDIHFYRKDAEASASGAKAGGEISMLYKAHSRIVQLKV
jgi:hypothetical protein